MSIFGRGFRTPWLAVSVLTGGWLRAAEPSASGIDFFEKRIRPLLADRCYQCHSAGAEKLKAGLRLDSRAGFLKGGDTGPAIIPGNGDDYEAIFVLPDDDDSRSLNNRAKKEEVGFIFHLESQSELKTSD